MSEGERRLVPVLAALQPRSEPDRNGILQTQGPYARRKGQNLRRAPEGHRRYLRPLRARRMLELFQCRRLCVRLNARCSSNLNERVARREHPRMTHVVRFSHWAIDFERERYGIAVWERPRHRKVNAIRLHEGLSNE